MRISQVQKFLDHMQLFRSLQVPSSLQVRIFASNGVDGKVKGCSKKIEVVVNPGEPVPPSVASRLWGPRLAIPRSSKGMLADLVSHLRTAVVPCWTFIDGSEHFLEYAIHVSKRHVVQSMPNDAMPDGSCLTYATVGWRNSIFSFSLFTRSELPLRSC